MNPTGAVRLKPLSAVQRKVISVQAQRFGLNPDKLDETVSSGNPIYIAAPFCQPFQLGLTESKQLGISVSPDFTFRDLPTQKLSEEQMAKLIEDGIIAYTFGRNQRRMAFTFSYMIWDDLEIGAQLMVDAIDLGSPNTIGIFGIQLNQTKGLVEDRRIVRPPLSETARRFLAQNNYDPNLVYQRRQELTFESCSLEGDHYVNLKVEPAYRDKGDQEFKGIAQILMTTALRLAAEQFFCVAYLMETQDALCHYFERTLGARRSIKYPTYAFHSIMACSFIGQPGFDYVDDVLSKRHWEAMVGDD